jgi:hypothetical protein
MNVTTALRLGRVSNLPTVWTNVAAGLALSGAAFGPGLMLSLGLAISVMYVGGMYLNDAFDREIDKRERPERPIPSGQVSAATVFALGFGMLALGLVIVALATLMRGQGGACLLAAAALAASIVVYDAFHKQNPFSPLLMALCRVLVYVTAALGTGAQLTAGVGWGCLVLLCYLIGLTYAAKQENLREPRGMWPLLLMQLPFLAYAIAFASPAASVMFFLLFGWVSYCLVFLVHPGRRNIKRAVGYMIAGISLLDGMLVASQGLASVALLCVAGFGATLLAQRFVPGT